MTSFTIALRLSLILSVVVVSSTALQNATTSTTESSFHGNSQFLQMLFDKYGDEDGVISYEAFERLMSKVGIAVVPQSGHTQRKSSESEHEQEPLQRPEHEHEHHNHDNDGASGDRSNPSEALEERGKRSVHGNLKDITRKERAVAAGGHTPQGRQCLTPKEILKSYHINVQHGITKPDFIHICPAIIYDIEQEACVYSAVPTNTGVGKSNTTHTHKHSNASEATVASRTFNKIPAKVWIYSLLAVSLISVAGLMCVAIIPAMQRCYFDEILQVLVALAVGTLTGDAMLHLMPHALMSGAESSNEPMTLDEHYDPVHVARHHAHDNAHHDAHTNAVWKGMTLLFGIYLFFILERIVNLVSDRRRQRRKNRKANGLYEIELDDAGNKRLALKEDGADVELVVKRSRGKDDYTNHHCDAERERHGHSHDVPDSVASIAWMVIMGDGLHNFTDGLAIGAAFSNGISGGFSTTVAVFCHELPHELGDFAVLLRAGMSVKKALFFNIISSALCFLGVVCGVLVGNIGGMNLWVFAFTAGIFVYLSLVDMVPELISGSKEGSRPLLRLLLQSIGCIAGTVIMMLIALFEEDLENIFGD